MGRCCHWNRIVAAAIWLSFVCSGIQGFQSNKSFQLSSLRLVECLPFTTFYHLRSACRPRSSTLILHAQQDPYKTNIRRTSGLASWSRKISHSFYQLWGRIQKFVRTALERYTIYVLECQDGKYYVGMTSHRQRRFRQHLSGGGSAWTQKYPPLQLWKEYRRVPQRYALGLEAQITAELMWKLGVNNVRGAMFAQTRAFHQGDVEPLVQFLGHYNGLPYRKVRQVLQSTLPPVVPTENMMERQRFQQTLPIPTRMMTIGPGQRKCYQCGKYGHLAAACPSSSGTSRKKCFQCGRYGHIASDCPESDVNRSKKSNNGSVQLCDYCAQMGHTSDNCPLL